MSRQYILHGLPEFYENMPGEYVRYLPRLDIKKDMAGNLLVTFHLMGQLIRDGIPQELFSELSTSPQEEEHRYVELSVDPDRTISFITAIIPDPEQLQQVAITQYIRDPGDKSVIRVSPFYSNAIYIIRFNDSEEVKIYSFYNGQLLHAPP